MTTTVTQIELTGLPDEKRELIQQQADEWGVSFDDACLQMLVEHARQLRAQQPTPWQRLLRRFGGNQSAH